jgi:hypothetical protein
VPECAPDENRAQNPLKALFKRHDTVQVASAMLREQAHSGKTLIETLQAGEKLPIPADRSLDHPYSI